MLCTPNWERRCNQIYSSPCCIKGFSASNSVSAMASPRSPSYWRMWVTIRSPCCINAILDYIKFLSKLHLLMGNVALCQISAEHLLRTDPVADKEGFFIALFTRETQECSQTNGSCTSRVHLKLRTDKGKLHRNKRRFVTSHLFPKMSRMWLHGRSRISARPNQI